MSPKKSEAVCFAGQPRLMSHNVNRDLFVQSHSSPRTCTRWPLTCRCAQFCKCLSSSSKNMSKKNLKAVMMLCQEWDLLCDQPQWHGDAEVTGTAAASRHLSLAAFSHLDCKASRCMSISRRLCGHTIEIVVIKTPGKNDQQGTKSRMNRLGNYGNSCNCKANGQNSGH